MHYIYLWDGRYIQGKKVGEAKTAKEAWQIAKSLLSEAGFQGPFKKKSDKRDIWLDDRNGNPVGLILFEEVE